MVELTNEEVALKLTAVYFQEIARRGYKRKLDLDSIINTYFYLLMKLQRKDPVCLEAEDAVLKMEEHLEDETEEELFPFSR
jgi:hypothetical protein